MEAPVQIFPIVPMSSVAILFLKFLRITNCILVIGILLPFTLSSFQSAVQASGLVKCPRARTARLPLLVDSSEMFLARKLRSRHCGLPALAHQGH